MEPAVATGVSHWPPGGAAAHSLILNGPQLPPAPSKQGGEKTLKIQADETELLLLRIPGQGSRAPPAHPAPPSVPVSPVSSPSRAWPFPADTQAGVA